jgi:hypothetical protein
MSASYYAYAGVYAIVQAVSKPIFVNKCSSCKRNAKDDDHFCSKCGSPVQHVQQGKVVRAYSPDCIKLTAVDLPKHCVALKPDSKEFGTRHDLSDGDNASTALPSAEKLAELIRLFEETFADELQAAHLESGQPPVVQVGLLTWVNA